MSQKPVLLLFAPALHNGYLQLFESLKDQVDTLYILGPALIAKFPLAAREPRVIEPTVMQKALAGLAIFKEVLIANEQDLQKLAEQKVPLLLAQDAISEQLVADFFPQSPVSYHSIFLRFDQATVQAATGVAEYDSQVTTEQFHREVMEKASLEAENSSDWFRHVGAALVLDSALKVVTHNQRMPTEQSNWLLGDPRNFIPYSSDPHLKTVAHAEEAILAHCAKEGIALKGAWLYVTTFPCPGCANVIALSGIARLYFSEGYAALKGDETLKIYGVEIIQVRGPK